MDIRAIMQQAQQFHDEDKLWAAIGTTRKMLDMERQLYGESNADIAAVFGS